jgi:predicted ester cyclase
VTSADAASLKSLLAPYRGAAAEGLAEASVRAALDAVLVPDAPVRLSHPIGTVPGGEFWSVALAPLAAAMPDAERRVTILVAGRTREGADWVGTCGHYMGTFAAPFLSIPPTGRLAHMRYHEFFRIEGGRVAEIQALWDIPELMMQAGAWPLAPQLGTALSAPAPASGDGLHVSGDGSAALERTLAMLTDLSRHPSEGGPEVMRLERHWHPGFNWYGPAGIGSTRGIGGFRRHHQIPFLRAFPDRGQDREGLDMHFFGEGDYAAVTGWPNMRMTHTGPGWLGLAPTGRRLTMRSLDFWRVERGRIRENWVLVDLLDALAQLGVDPLARLAEIRAMPEAAA